MSQKDIPRGTVLVTGGARRIGKAICLELASLGYTVALHYNRSKSEARKTANQIDQSSRRGCFLFHGDLSKEQEVSSLIKEVKKKCPDLNLLVNNASIFTKTLFRNTSLDSLNKHFAINFKAAFILSRDFARVCKNGQIINILDTNIAQNQSNYFTYLLSKKALGELTMMTAVELAPQIRVNGIAPGLILPPQNKNIDYLLRLAKNIPLKKKGDINNVLQSLRFLLENTFVTGQIIFPDGGEHLI